MTNRIMNLIKVDIKRIVTDPNLSGYLLVPIALIFFIRYFVPYITNKYPVIADYHHLIMMSGVMQTAIIFGFITSFMILDEKDENVLQVIQVMPISPFYFIVYRLTFATFFSIIGAFIMFVSCDIAYPGMVNVILLSILYGLAAPFMALIIATFANNKIEGMAYFKFVDLILMVPLMSLFIGGFLKYGFAIIPVFWAHSLYQLSLDESYHFIYFLIGILFNLFALFILFKQFKKRVFDR